MQTIDIHTHLLNREVAFDRPFDRAAVHLFARSLGADPRALKQQPYQTYIEAMARAVAESNYVRKTCLFGVDARFDEQGREVDRDRTVCAMNEDVVAVAASYPDQFIPFLSVNPRRPGALDLIDEFAERGCRGAKFLQNYWGVDLNSEQLIPYYEKLKQHRLPLIVHIGSEYTIHSYPSYERVEMLDLPLGAGVTVIAAHMGLGRYEHKLRAWRNLSRQPCYFDRDYFRLLEMLTQYQNLYADISAILAPFRARALRHLSEQQQVHEKILFGSDFPVPFTVRHNSFDLNKATRRRIAQIENPFDRYTAVMLEYFPAESPIYRNHTKLLSAVSEK
ncbi:amidohydrolase family protein [Candidatus Thiodiazotropha sp. CDECU1]|uniref:amidohydrolase family protein n=1 Tax=Candidatus Thiodiazotropha sp. CDECU1 TaxID=3065865 RepID=UPI00292D4A2F|nr:amidohydrolase family protein [Candidatus Thiodiazotropha sp. CDECU1]